MKQVLGIWLPDSDVHLAEHVASTKNPLVDGKGTYQFNKYRAAVEHVTHRGHAVDIGANVGLWTRIMEAEFLRVTALEPVGIHRDCFLRNTSGKARLYPFAVGAARGRTWIEVPPDHTASAHVSFQGEDVEIVTIDSLDLGHVDFMKIDIEGFEYDAVIGAEHTIRTSRPVMIVEQKPGNAERFGHGQHDAVNLLKSWGMTEAVVLADDYVMVWP